MTTDRKVLNKLTRMMNYFKNKKYTTLHFLLTEGTGVTLDLTGIKGTLKSAFIKASGAVVYGGSGADTTDALNVTIVWQGSSIATTDNLALAHMDNGPIIVGNASGTTKYYNVISDLDLDASNTYNLVFVGTGTSPLSLYKNAELIITFEPEGL